MQSVVSPLVFAKGADGRYRYVSQKSAPVSLRRDPAPVGVDARIFGLRSLHPDVDRRSLKAQLRKLRDGRPRGATAPQRESRNAERVQLRMLQQGGAA
jgi:hypothetical protein